MELVASQPQQEQAEEVQPKRSQKRRAEDRAKDAETDWKRAAPRWLLIALLVAAAWKIGQQNTRIDEQQKLAEAMVMMEARAREKAMERIATAEEQNRQLKELADQQRAWNEKMSTAVHDLASSIRVLAVKVDKRN